MTRSLRKNNVKKYNYQFVVCIMFFFVTVLAGISTFASIGGIKTVIFPATEEETHESAFIPDNGLHGVWVTTVGNADFPSKQGLSAEAQKKEADAILDKVVDLGLNAVFLQVRPNSDALYKSEIYPWSSVLTGTQGKDPGYDPLAYFVEGAHKRNLKIEAWINPYRVQTKSDKTKLCSTQPALLNPEWTVETKEKQLYYDPGIPKVRELIENGITEIVSNYEVDGIVFDDYFYPDKDFSDENTFKTYCAKGQNVEDFRRTSVNSLVKECYEKIKAINPDVDFGISPAGVWANSDQTLLGSNTNGAFSSYYDQYADTRLWVKNNWLDFICPQIYWSIGHDKADYLTLLDWWANTVKGTNVDLYISHGAYNQGSDQKGWTSPDQITRQLTEANKYEEYKGSVFYDYADLCSNKDGFATAITNYYNGKLIASSFGKSLIITSPQNNTTTSESKIRITGSSDYNFPLLLNGNNVERGEDGYFSTYVNLNPGKNEFTFTHKGETIKLVINSSTSVLVSVLPNKDIIADGGSQINISAVAHVNAIVTAKVGSQTIKMSPADSAGVNEDNKDGSSSSDYVTFTGIFTLPETTPEVQDLGKISVTATWSGVSKTLTGSNVKVNALSVKTGEKCIATLASCSSINSKFIETFIYADNLYRPVACPQIPGSWDYIETNKDGSPKKYFYDSMTYYRLSCGLMLYSGNVKVSAVKDKSPNEVKSVSQSTYDSGRYTRFTFSGSSKITYNAGTDIAYKNISYNSSGKRDYAIDSFNAKTFCLYLFNTTKAANINLKGNPLFSSVSMTKVNSTTIKYSFVLKKPGNFYGFDVNYDGNNLVLDCKNPWSGKNAELKVSIDAGHGGSDFGAIGGNANEKDLNLKFSKQVKNILINKYGLKESNIYMIRTTDTLIADTKNADLQKRTLNIINSKSDVSICIHQNSGGGEGFETYYFQPFSQDLAASVQSNLALAYSKSGFKAQNRGYKFCSERSFYSCRQTQFPSVLIECGFIDSTKDRGFLTSSNGSNAICEAIAKSVVDYAKSNMS